MLPPSARALGLSVHTGWAACVVASGTARQPVIHAREEIALLGDPERFVFHRAAELLPEEAAASIERARAKAVASALAALRRLTAEHSISRCAIVAKGGPMPSPLTAVLAAHPRLHVAEGCLYRDVLVEAAAAIGVSARVIDPRDIEAASAGVKAAGAIVGRPWGRDQKLATLAAWQVLESSSCSPRPVRGAMDARRSPARDAKRTSP